MTSPLLTIRQTLHQIFVYPILWTSTMCIAGIGYLFMPERGKRIFYVTSLYAFQHQLDTATPNDELLQQLQCLNLRLHLTHRDERALLLPLFVYHRIWRSINQEECHGGVYQRDVDTAEYIIHCAPRWVRYNNQRMLDDTLSVLREQDQCSSHRDDLSTIVKQPKDHVAST